MAMCRDMCVDMCMGMRVDICVDLHIASNVGNRSIFGICLNTCLDTYLDTRALESSLNLAPCDKSASGFGAIRQPPFLGDSPTTCLDMAATMLASPIGSGGSHGSGAAWLCQSHISFVWLRHAAPCTLGDAVAVVEYQSHASHSVDAA